MFHKIGVPPPNPHCYNISLPCGNKKIYQHVHLYCNCRSQGNDSYTYIGLVKTTGDPSSLRWKDGTPFEYNNSNFFQNWYPGEPHSNDFFLCIVIEQNAGSWGSLPCVQMMWAMCESQCKFIGKHFHKYDLF